jgi:hypothetical protein
MTMKEMINETFRMSRIAKIPLTSQTNLQEKRHSTSSGNILILEQNHHKGSKRLSDARLTTGNLD